MFFRAKELVVLDVSSKALTAVVAERKSQGVFFVKAFSEIAYSGFEDGNWFDIDELKSCAIQAVENVLSGKRVSKLFISVPAEFATVNLKDVNIVFDRERNINESDVNYLFKKGDTFSYDSHFSLINTSAVFFSTDSVRLLNDPRGVKARRLSAQVSYISAERGFRELFDYIAYELRFSTVEYISSEWAQTLTLLEREQRDRQCLFLNVGYLSSSVSMIKGDGLVGLKSFSLGGAHIIADIFEKFDAPFDIAQEVFDKIDLNLSYTEEDYIMASDGSGFLCLELSEVIKDSLDTLIVTIAKAIEMLKYDMNSFQPIYLSGEGITSLRGAIKYVEDAFGKSIDVLKPRVPLYNKPQHSSAMSLVSVASKLDRKQVWLYKVN